VQYRGHILPLVWLSEMFGSGGAGDEVLALVVTKVEGHSVGLVADAIIDTVEAVVEVETPPSQLGLRGSAVIAGRVTELVNVDDMVGALAPEILEFIADEAPSALTGVSR
jgi:two-component system chemotaxis sensor kinase CheA